LNSGKLEKTILQFPWILRIHGITEFLDFAEFLEFRSSKILAIPGFSHLFEIWRIKSWNLEKNFSKSQEFQEFIKLIFHQYFLLHPLIPL
jgi:hypothetical protein